MQKPDKTRVVIAGGGTAGWITAYSLSKRLAPFLDITLVESDQIGTVGVGEATIPSMKVFHQLVDIDEQEFMRETQATFKLGISLENWGNIGDKYIHSFGTLGQGSWIAQFHEYWLEAQEKGFAGSMDDYCLELKAAKQGKFATKINNTTLLYAYHLNATAYAQFLRKKSEQQGVTRVEGKISDIKNDPASGDITSLHLDNGKTIEGDFFIDCTGFRALLLGENLKVGFEDWSHWLKANRAIAVQTELVGDPVTYTRSISHASGWQWQIPLQSRMGNGIIYCDKYISDDEAKQTLYDNLPGEPLTEPNMLRFSTGRREKFWHKNCVAIGLSSGFLEPLESTSIHLITTAVIRLMRLFPFSENNRHLADEFNDLTLKEMESVRDLVIFHYKQTERNDSEYWNDYRTMDVPESLTHRIEIFRNNGYTSSDGVFHVTSWVQVMMGQGIYPKQHHSATRILPPDELKQQLDKIRSHIDMNLKKLPSHKDFIKQYCPAPPMSGSK
ncbi:MAG: tryptophan 7-halogenase [Pseudomonadales bacterium]